MFLNIISLYLLVFYFVVFSFNVCFATRLIAKLNSIREELYEN